MTEADSMPAYTFPVWGTQGGGLVRQSGKHYIFVEKPDCPGLDVGDKMPDEWGLAPANQAARDDQNSAEDDKDDFLVSGDLDDCAYCSKPFVGEGAYCGTKCSATAITEGWSSDGKSPEEQLTAQLIAQGDAAPIEEVLKHFDKSGNLGSFARRDMPKVCEVLGIKTIGDLAKHTRSEIVGPQCRYAGNKTLSWIEMVLRQFKKCLTVPLSEAEQQYIRQHGVDKF